MALKKSSQITNDGCCPKCGYAVMRRGVNAVTGNLAIGLDATLATGAEPTRARAEDDQVWRLRNQVPTRLTGHRYMNHVHG